MVDVPDVLELTGPQARVLGSLLEKAATTPDAYPLTLNALTTACNQSSNRDPVVGYDTQLVETTVLALKAKGLARVVHPGSGERATKYRHVVDEALGLEAAERGAIAVLLLRGPQTASELLTRTERLHRFGSLGELESTLHSLAAGERPLVTRLERQAGQKEPRWIQLLEADAEGRAARAASSSVSGSQRSAGRIDDLERRVETLERDLARLTAALDGLIDLSEADDDASDGDGSPPG